MFHSFAESSKLPKEIQRVTSYEGLKRIFQIEKLWFRFTRIPKNLVLETSISSEAKIFWAILHQLCGLGCYYYSQADLSKITGVTVRMIQIYKKELEDTGWLETERSEEDNRKKKYSTKSSRPYVAMLNKYLFDFTVSSKAKILWLVLQELGDADGKSWYGLTKLKARCGWKDKETLKKYRKELIKAEWLELQPSKKHRGVDSFVRWPENRPNPKLISARKKSKMAEKRR